MIIPIKCSKPDHWLRITVVKILPGREPLRKARTLDLNHIKSTEPIAVEILKILAEMGGFEGTDIQITFYAGCKNCHNDIQMPYGIGCKYDEVRRELRSNVMPAFASAASNVYGQLAIDPNATPKMLIPSWMYTTSLN